MGSSPRKKRKKQKAHHPLLGLSRQERQAICIYGVCAHELFTQLFTYLSSK